jgi:cellulose synthase/poly-beta-1,6-N-acetylglucosamine synthase-like glycosyltransferase
LNNLNSKENLPSVAIVIPAKNEEQYIARCLEAVSQQDYPKEKFKIFLIDNLSTDKTIELARQFTSVEIHTCGGNISQIRNCGRELTDGDYLAFIDSDCIPPTDWLRKSVEILRENQDIAVTSAILTLEPITDIPWIEKYWVNYLRAGNVKSHNLVDTISSFCFVISRETMNKVGWFNESLATCEDSDLGYRIRSTGAKLCVRKDIPTIHLGNAKTIKQFFMRQLWQGSNNLKNMISHHFELNELPSILVPSITFATQILILIMAFLVPALSAALLGGLVTLVLLVAIKKNKPSNLNSLVIYSFIWYLYLTARGAGMLIKINRWDK